MERASSIFSQIIRLVPRGLFDEAVAHHQGEKHAKGMTCWSLFVTIKPTQPTTALPEGAGGHA